MNTTDRKTRDKALESLTLFLRSRTDLTLVDLLKLWKGLFFCKSTRLRALRTKINNMNRLLPLRQTSHPASPRARSLLLPRPLPPHQTVHRFLRAFWITIGRDFHSLDRLRLDKYLFLIRCYVGVAFEAFVKRKTEQNQEDGKKRKREDTKQSKQGGKRQKKQEETKAASIVEDEETSEGKWADLEAYISIIEEGPLCPRNFDPDQPSKPVSEEGGDPNFVPMPHGPDGLRYHVVDIWVDELEKVLEFEEEESEGNRKIKGDVPMELLLRPLEKLRTESPYKPVRTRAAEALGDDRLVEWGVRERKVEEEEEEDSEQEWGGFGDD